MSKKIDFNEKNKNELENKSLIRQPIVTVAGHVDHGKTTLLDSIRGTCIAKKEAGAITQKISFALFPKKSIGEKCDLILKKFNIPLEIPGLLFIDTPGHAAFTNLRKRGGALADIAILVIDINQGIQEQTRESIEILKTNKVPFVVALNKVDALPGWRNLDKDLMKSMETQSNFTKENFDKKIYSIINSFSVLGFDSDLFFRISKFEKQLALIPCSAKTGEGIPELISMLVGLSQRFLKEGLSVSQEAKGTILEVKKEKGLTNVEAILYDGTLKKTDLIIMAGFEKASTLKLRALFEALPLCQGYKSVKETSASAGVQMHFPSDDVEKILPGMPFFALHDTKKETILKAEQEIQQSIGAIIETQESGIVIKADSLGSLEALLFLLKKYGITIKKAGIGNINKFDYTLAKSILEKDPLNAVILGFNVGAEKEVLENKENVKVITSEVIYKLVEDLEKWKIEREIEIQRESLKDVSWPVKITLINNACFNDSKPAIFGITVNRGLLKKGITLMDETGKEIDEIKEIQSEKKSVEKVASGKDVAINLPKTTYSRQLKQGMILYSSLKEDDFLKLKENKKYLSGEEILLLQEIAEIKRKIKPTWGF